MATQTGLAISTTRTWLTWLWTAIGYTVIGLTALIFRTHDLGGFVTVDEINFWVHRSEQFLNALQSGDYAATAISYHPGVTTMWLGSAGLLLRQFLSTAGLLEETSFPILLMFMRLPAALIHTLGVLLGYRLLRCLLPPYAALLAAFFWAVDPFVIAYSRLLHVDGLATTFGTLSLLAACVYWHHEHKASTLLLSAVCCGLAILSKSPSLILLPFVGLLAAAAQLSEVPPQAQQRSWWRLARALISRSLLIWCMILIATLFVLWPAMWIDPLRVYKLVLFGAEAEGLQPHMHGNFFLGRPIDAPGPLFYAATLALRTTPWTLLGLLLLGMWRTIPAAARRDLAALAGFVILFTLAMSIFPKKFNRYLVQAFPIVDILAAYGLLWGLGWLGKLTRATERIPPLVLRYVQSGWISILMGLALINAWAWHPYQIAAFNQLLGGAQAGAETFMIGWGEGLEQAAAWLNKQPDITGVRTASTLSVALQPYLRKGAQAMGPRQGKLPEKTGYVVIYVRSVQDGLLAPPFDQFYGRAKPLHIVSVKGLDYVWIYHAPPSIEQLRPAAFGPDIRLYGFSQQGSLQRGQTVSFRLVWEPRTPPPIDYTLFAHLIGPDGQRYAQVDLLYPTSQWSDNRYTTTEMLLSIPAEAPAGTYRVAIGLYNAADGARLPLKATDALTPAVAGPDALLLTPLKID